MVLFPIIIISEYEINSTCGNVDFKMDNNNDNLLVNIVK